MRNSFNPVKGPSLRPPGNARGARDPRRPQLGGVGGMLGPASRDLGPLEASLLKAQPKRQQSFVKPGLWHPREAAGAEAERKGAQVGT